jgi:hypothetical protein
VLLRTEIDRIRRLDAGFTTDLTESARGTTGRGESPSTSKRRVALGRAVTESGSSPTSAITEVGTIGVGPVSVPLGGVAKVLRRALGPSVSGMVVKLHGNVTVVADYSGRGRLTLTAKRAVADLEDPAKAQEFVRELAHRMLWTDPGSAAEETSWLRRAHLVEGRGALERYLLGGSVVELALAERELVRAAVASGAVAPARPDSVVAEAYMDLSVVYQERSRLPGRDRLRELNAAIALCERAARINPDSASIHLRVAELRRETEGGWRGGRRGSTLSGVVRAAR